MPDDEKGEYDSVVMKAKTFENVYASRKRRMERQAFSQKEEKSEK